MKLVKRLFINRKCLTGIPGICFYIKRVIKLLLLIKSLTALSCEKTVACQDKLPVMFWDVLRATDDVCPLVCPSPVTCQQAFLLQTQHESWPPRQGIASRCSIWLSPPVSLKYLLMGSSLQSILFKQDVRVYSF